MTNTELQALFETSSRRVDELAQKYRATGVLTRREANDLRHAVQRIGLIAREGWIAAGCPEGFPELEHPIKLSPLPASMRPLDLSAREITGGLN